MDQTVKCECVCVSACMHNFVYASFPLLAQGKYQRSVVSATVLWQVTETPALSYVPCCSGSVVLESWILHPGSSGRSLQSWEGFARKSFPVEAL